MNTRATPHATDNIHKRRQSGDRVGTRHGGNDMVAATGMHVVNFYATQATF